MTNVQTSFRIIFQYEKFRQLLVLKFLLFAFTIFFFLLWRGTLLKQNSSNPSLVGKSQIHDSTHQTVHRIIQEKFRIPSAQPIGHTLMGTFTNFYRKVKTRLKLDVEKEDLINTNV